ncbi:MAG: YbaK/EbsC family protein [Rhodobacter sp.]|nr:YbaK/EbsC family protein [Rhodobacter sp.]MCA3455819.1 YbaK/EbsC family protein [Rhodobacter sp.]MCA3459830.1 YbaK/EbsC family protein [Rhodobacter sp.]MCA3463545.1 YbaK/EbsC family protein [Rhodobacter sp.]MCA3468235.1 YbaK/EbsC family protein [Rhodobacter sp.]
MSKSLERVRAALDAAGVAFDLREMAAETRTAEQAAAAAGCALDQIVKSVLFRGSGSGQLRLFLTAGGNRIDPDRASTLAQEPLERADAALIRAETGFAIGGVAPLGHLNPCALWMDPRLMDFAVVWAAAGTPRHIFAIAPAVLRRITGAALAEFTAQPAPRQSAGHVK